MSRICSAILNTNLANSENVKSNLFELANFHKALLKKKNSKSISKIGLSRFPARKLADYQKKELGV